MRGRREFGIPLYRQVYLVLRDGIASGRYAAGRPVPPEVDLTRQFDVSRVTIRKALEVLQREGLIERRQGDGTYVRDGKDQPSPMVVAIESAMDRIEGFTRGSKARVVEFGYREPPEAVKTSFSLSEGGRMQYAERLREVDGEALLHVATWIPEAIGRNWDSADMEQELIGALLARAGVRPASGEQRVLATLADPSIARLMALDVGAPLLRIQRLVRDSNRRPVMQADLLVRADRINVSVALKA